ncbi:hypothetical protein [Pseudoalteromonas marina]|uniref:Uncharacterized protein n=1 Tax=Pseudoalteromonas marina TaxID=267375 RepID=A0ABT9FHW3_9GAMM|nr:hypothetical protein [Pseudoalteromonas marina]MDP2566386.1 hypothetical protein [Pseudoalteromonas marina]
MTILCTANKLTKYSSNFISLLKDNSNKHSQIEKALATSSAHTVGMVILTNDNKVILKKNTQGNLELPLTKITGHNIEIDALSVTKKFTTNKIKQKYMFRIALKEGQKTVTSHIFMTKISDTKDSKSIVMVDLGELNNEIDKGNLIDPTTIIALDGVLQSTK